MRDAFETPVRCLELVEPLGQLIVGLAQAIDLADRGEQGADRSRSLAEDVLDGRHGKSDATAQLDERARAAEREHQDGRGEQDDVEDRLAAGGSAGEHQLCVVVRGTG